MRLQRRKTKERKPILLRGKGVAREGLPRGSLLLSRFLKDTWELASPIGKECVCEELFRQRDCKYKGMKR